MTSLFGATHILKKSGRQVRAVGMEKVVVRKVDGKERKTVYVCVLVRTPGAGGVEVVSEQWVRRDGLRPLRSDEVRT